MTEIPAEAIEEAARAIMSAANMNDDEPERFESRHLARAALEAAAPLLAETVAQKITAHMEGFGPRRPAGALEPVTATGRDYRTWRRHFGIAARIAAGAFDTREDQLRKAAEAIERGDFIACAGHEVPGG